MKDLVDHVRTVHFTVFVVALILTMALRGRTRPQLDRAATDAEAILLLQQQWPQVREAFTKMANIASNGPLAVMEPTGRHLLETALGRYSAREYSAYPNRQMTFDVEATWIYVDGSEPDENIGWGESQELFERRPMPWKTLIEFRKF